MGWWDHLQTAQGTVIGGAFVLLAAFVAFGTGFLQRKKQQRIYHYEEVKRAYADSLAFAIAGRVLHKVPEEERREVVRRLESTAHEISARLALTVPTKSADLVEQYTRLAIRKSQQELGIPEDERTPMLEPDEDYDATVQHIRRQTSRYLLPLSKHRRDLRKRIPGAAKVPKQLLKCGPLVINWE